MEQEENGYTHISRAEYAALSPWIIRLCLLVY